MSANTDKDGESCPLRFDINGMHAPLAPRALSVWSGKCRAWKKSL